MLTVPFVQHVGVDAIVQRKMGNRHIRSARRHGQLFLEFNKVIATAFSAA